jgi:hypothetical protein
VEELTKDKAELKRSNDLMRTQLDLLEQQNRTLLMNQLSGQTAPQLNTPRNFAAINSMGGMQNAGAISGGNHLFNLPQNSLGPASVGSGGNNILSGDAANSLTFLGAGGGGAINNTLGSFSLLDRLRLQQQLQQQQLGLMSQLSGSGPNTTSHDLMLNNLRNSNNNNSSSGNSNSNNYIG